MHGRTNASFIDTDAVLKWRNLTMRTTSVGAVAGVVRITDQYGSAVLNHVRTVAE